MSGPARGKYLPCMGVQRTPELHTLLQAPCIGSFPRALLPTMCRALLADRSFFLYCWRLAVCCSDAGAPVPC